MAGRNFGCGSSREHAPWALLDYGFRAVISTEIADIFRGNSLKNGLLPIVVDEHTSQWLLQHPGVEVDIDLQGHAPHTADRRVDFFCHRTVRAPLPAERCGRIRLPAQQARLIERFEAARREAVCLKCKL